MKKAILIFVGILSFWGSTGGALYAETGKRIFKNKCVSCHRSIEVNISVSPVDKASFQWQYFLHRHKHKRRYKVDLKTVLTKSEFKLLETYLVNHASDSDFPEVIGKR